MGVLNPADVLSKHWGFAEAWPRIRPILFWMGDTNMSGDGVAVKGEKNSSMRDDGEYQAEGLEYKVEENDFSPLTNACKVMTYDSGETEVIIKE